MIKHHSEQFFVRIAARKPRTWHRRFAVECLLLIAITNSAVVFGQHQDSVAKDASENQKTIATITADALKSIVVVRQMNRDGESHAIGSGFAISDDGLIATNLHVIGEARPLQVEAKDGRKYRVEAVHASERQMDLAILKVADPIGLKPLPLADAKLRQGEPVIAIGHPRGLKHSVVEGLLSAWKDVDGQTMLQLSIPIEQGNSGGPVLDRQGRVHGILTLKSLQAENTGFAVDAAALKQLIAKPNPIRMDRWLTIGELDTRLWEPIFEARWMQRVDRILVDGSGSGFGGRSLCLRREPITEAPTELSVDVRMDHESGAAGLVIYSDGKNRHYGFYPSNGRLRLTRFDGPDVYSWNVLQEVKTDAYRPGEWNNLRVVLSDGKMECYVNNQLVFTSLDRRYTSGRPGFAKFRQTQAEFRNFRIARLTTPAEASRVALDRWRPVATGVKSESDSLSPTDVDQLANDAGVTVNLLEERARKLEQQANEIRKLSDQLNTHRVQQRLISELAKPEAKINLLRATLLIAQLDNPGLEIELFEREVERMAEHIRDRLDDDADEQNRIDLLNRYLFKENGFHGNRVEYYTRSNSYMNDVIYNRQGLPITLSVLYLEIAERIGLKVVGVGLPGHFVVRWEHTKNQKAKKEPADEPTTPRTQLIDPFERGATISRQDAEAMIRAAGLEVSETYFAAYTKPQIVERMFRNLIGLAEQNRDTDRLLRYMDTLVRLFPQEVEFRAKRVDLNSRTGQIEAAIADIDWFLEHKPDGVELEKLREFRQYLFDRR